MFNLSLEKKIQNTNMFSRSKNIISNETENNLEKPVNNLNLNSNLNKDLDQELNLQKPIINQEKLENNKKQDEIKNENKKFKQNDFKSNLKTR